MSVIYTAAGGMKIIYPKDLGYIFRRQPLETDTAEVIMQNEMDVDFGYSARLDNNGFNEKLDASYVKSYIVLNEFKRIDHSMRLKLKSSSPLHLQEYINSLTSDKIVNDFKIMVAQKDPQLNIRDLSLDNIEVLATEYAMRFGSDEMYGLEINLSKYQKFFVMFSQEDFVFYQNTVENSVIPEILLRGKLVNTNPSKMVMARYDNKTYLKELSHMQKFVSKENASGHAAED